VRLRGLDNVLGYAGKVDFVSGGGGGIVDTGLGEVRAKTLAVATASA
jgi:hypothetical protein